MPDEAGKSTEAPKAKRPPHPNSLANLRAPWKPGQSGHPEGLTKPMITPHLRRFAEMTIEELKEIDVLKLTGGQAIAYGMIVKAATERAWGDKTREQVLARLDGAIATGDAHATAIAMVVNVIRGGDTLGMTPSDG